MSKPVFEDILRFSGRRNRLSYLLYSLAAFIGLALIWGIAIAMIGRHEWSMTVLAGLVTVPVFLSLWAVSAQRCRDFGWTGWAVLITLVPYIGWLFSFIVIFVPGNAGTNRYGPDPLAGTQRY